MLTPHWNNSWRGQRPGVTAETPVSEQPLTTLFKCKVRDSRYTQAHADGEISRSDPRPSYISFTLAYKHCKIIPSCAVEVPFWYLVCNVKQSSLIHTKGLRLLTYIHLKNNNKGVNSVHLSSPLTNGAVTRPYVLSTDILWRLDQIRRLLYFSDG